jgi:hypothetical protein
VIPGRTIVLSFPAASHLNPGIAVLTVVASIALSAPAIAQSSLPASGTTESVTGAPPMRANAAASAPSAWSAAEPWRTDRFYLETSLYTRHFHFDPAHDNHQEMTLGEWNVTERWLIGAAAFDNSFGQPSQYVYGGYRLRPFENLQPLYVKLSAGLVHGYTGQYQSKIPFNNSGVAPVIVPSVGYCVNRFCSELVVFGAAGVIVTFGVTLP